MGYGIKESKIIIDNHVVKLRECLRTAHTHELTSALVVRLHREDVIVQKHKSDIVF